MTANVRFGHAITNVYTLVIILTTTWFDCVVNLK